MKNLIKADAKKLIYDWRIWIVLVAACLVPFAFIIVSAVLPQIDVADIRAGDYVLLSGRIQNEVALQDDKTVKRDYEEQYALVQQMADCYRQGMTAQELLLQNDMERAELAGKKQVYYEDVFSKYLGLGNKADIERRIYYREYLVQNDFNLFCSLDTEYSVIRIIYGFIPVLMPLVVLIVCMTITMLFTNEALGTTTKFLLTCPYKRWKILLSKLLLSLIAAGVILLLFTLAMVSPLCFQQNAVPLTYPIEIDFPVWRSFMIGNAQYITAADFLLQCLLFFR